METNEIEIWKSRLQTHEDNYNETLKRVDELVAENKLWQEEAKRWRDMYIQYEELLESQLNEATARLEKVGKRINKLKKKVEDKY
jgi:predicted  nucleic acid-binding Zn-ribbon protein